MKETLSRYNIENSDGNRIHILNGDLTLNQFGLDNKTWQQLEIKIDTICHNGAWAHHLYDYTQLKETNVESTKTLITLATTKKLKSIHYISTISAASQFSNQGDVLEVGPGSHPPSLGGYLATKWTSEKILWNMFANGLPGNIYRAGNITGHSKTGISNYENNHALLLLKGCLQLGAAPDLNMTLEMTPVDTLAQAIIMLSKKTVGNVYHLNNPNKLSWKDYINIVSQTFKIKYIDTTLWQEKYLKKVGEDNALYTIKGFYNQAGNTEMVTQNIQTQNTHKILKELGVLYPQEYNSLIKLYLEFLTTEKFLSF